MGHWIKPLLAQKDLGRVLYVGAHGLRGRKPALLDKIRSRSNCVDCVEVFPENVLRVERFFDSVRCEDVREEVKYCGFVLYDTVVWWHGPEHVPFADGVNVLDSIKSKNVWVGCPYGGDLPVQGAMYGNPNEAHVSDWYPLDFDRLGYRLHHYMHRGKWKISAWRFADED